MICKRLYLRNRPIDRQLVFTTPNPHDKCNSLVIGTLERVDYEGYFVPMKKYYCQYGNNHFTQMSAL